MPDQVTFVIIFLSCTLFGPNFDENSIKMRKTHNISYLDKISF